jgi:nitrite reductase/ring-hydroxylating ferredoxin subunit
MAPVAVAKASEIPEGGMVAKEHAGKLVVLAKVKGKIYAMDNVCTHQGAPLHEGVLGEGGDPFLLTCPWHEAHFDLRTGKVYQDTPWATDTETFHVEVKGDDVYVDI